jgi:hypothetical protein
MVESLALNQLGVGSTPTSSSNFELIAVRRVSSAMPTLSDLRPHLGDSACARWCTGGTTALKSEGRFDSLIAFVGRVLGARYATIREGPKRWKRGLLDFGLIPSVRANAGSIPRGPA